MSLHRLTDAVPPKAEVNSEHERLRDERDSSSENGASNHALRTQRGDGEGLLQRGAMPRFSLNDDGIVVRAQQKLLKRLNVIWVVQSLLQKYFASPVGQIISTNSRHPTPQEGRIMIVTNAGWVAVDAAAFCARWDRRVGRKTCERSTARGREMLQRTAKSCGPDAPTLASSSRSCVGPTGLRQNLIRRRRLQNSPATGESAK